MMNPMDADYLRGLMHLHDDIRTRTHQYLVDAATYGSDVNADPEIVAQAKATLQGAEEVSKAILDRLEKSGGNDPELKRKHAMEQVNVSSGEDSPA